MRHSDVTTSMKKSGKLKFAFAWNLLGGAHTQGFYGSRKEISCHTAATTEQGNDSLTFSHL